MAVRKLKQAETDEQRRSRERAAPVLRAREQSDPTGEHTKACRAIADAAGVDVSHVVEAWHERAAIRTYDGNTPLWEAERLAVEDVRAIFRPRHKGLAL